MSALYYDIVDTSLGVLTLVASERGLQRILHANSICEAQSEVARVASEAVHSPDVLSDDVKRLSDYMQGRCENLAFKLDMQGGTTLQRQVWQALAQIPRGETLSYSQLASNVGKPKAVRAVASACGKNPLPIIIPCHRVLAKDGGLGGFAWGLSAKRSLLALEKVAV